MSRFSSFSSRFSSTRLRRVLLGTLGATLIAGGLSACGHGPIGEMTGRGGPRTEADMARHQERMVDRVASGLELDAAQKALLTQLATKMRAQRAVMMGAPGQGGPREEFKAIIAGERFDTARAQALVNGKADAIRSGSPELIAAAAAFYDSLKPAQQQKVREFLDQRGGRGHHGGRHWG